MTAIENLLTEAKTLKNYDQLRMLCSQFLAASFQQEHDSFLIVSGDSGQWEQKQTLQTAFLDQNEDLLVHGSCKVIETTRWAIYTKAVEVVIDTRGQNRILGTKPPDVDKKM